MTPIEVATAMLESLCSPAKVRNVSIEGKKVSYELQCFYRNHFYIEDINFGVLESIFQELNGESVNEASEEQIEEIRFFLSKFTCKHINH